MNSIKEGSLTFEFPDNWQASKFDDWQFYRKQFMKIAEAKIACSKCGSPLKCSKCGSDRVAGNMGIDILALDTQSQCWLIEIKDYRTSTRSNTSDLADEVALKVRDTLAALLAARVNANDPGERSMAARAAKCESIRVVLHLELPPERSRRGVNKNTQAALTMKLKQLVKSIDPHPLIVNCDPTGNLDWMVN